MTHPVKHDIVLEAISLSKSYKISAGLFARPNTLHAVQAISLRVHRGETLGLVGESGCGKSTLGRCLLRLQTLSAGAVLFSGQDISKLSMRALRPLRPRMQMVFQDPYGSLNPRRSAQDIIAEPLRVHPDSAGRPHSQAAISARLAELVALVGLRADHLPRYPHEFSGGQRQRIGIARALALNPDLIIADEPVSALDVSVQAQVVNLLMDLQESLGLTYVFIAHDLAVVRQIATRTAVMYLGRIVETGPTADLFAQPLHPYTASLLASIPGTHAAPNLHGEPPSPTNPPPGCHFHPRCPRAQASCREQAPALGPLGGGREVACYFPL